MNLLTIDTETEPLLPEGKVRSSHQVPKMVCLTWARRGEGGLLSWDTPGAAGLLLDLIGPDTNLVFHNAKFDLAVLSRWAPELRAPLMALVDAGRVLDTRVLYSLRYPLKDRPRTLAHVVYHLFRERLEKGEVRTSFRRGQELTAAQRPYALPDPAWTLRVAERLLELPLGALARHPAGEFEVTCSPEYQGDPPDVLYSSAAAYLAWFLEPEGLPVNLASVDERHTDLEASELDLCEELYRSGLMRPVRLPGVPRRVKAFHAPSSWEIHEMRPLTLRRRLGSAARGYFVAEIRGKWVLNTSRLGEAFTEAARELGLQPPRTAKGSLSMEYEFWKEYKNDLPAILRRYLELSKVRKYKSSFVGPLAIQRPARVFPSYLIPGAETGRWSCARPNIQQQPKKLRPMYGGETLGADYKSLECFTLAHCLRALGLEGPLQEVLRQEDFHTFTAQQINVTRQAAKVATFGLAGGMGFLRFYKYVRYQCGLDVDFEAACDLRRRWLGYFTDVSAFLDLFRLDYYELCPVGCSKRAWLRDLDFDPEESWPSSFELSRRLGGRICCTLPSGRVIPQRNFSQAANVFFQGTGADVMTQAFVDLCRRRIPVSAVVHDAAYTTDPLGAVDLGPVMHEALAKVCPSVADCSPVPQLETAPTFF